MSLDDIHDDREFDAGPLGVLPWLSGRQAKLAAKLARPAPESPFDRALGRLKEIFEGELEVGQPEVLWRASGLVRTGCVVQFVWTRLSTRLALGIDTPLAHAIVDRLLGFDRSREESRLQVSPVEWGVLTFVLADGLNRLSGQTGPLGPWDLTVDRVSADPFDVRELGRVITVHWPLRLGDAEGSLRAWLPESLVSRWLTSSPRSPAEIEPGFRARAAEFSGVWRANAGTIRLPRGLRTLKPGGVLPLVDSSLGGTPQDPSGVVELSLTTSGPEGRFLVAAQPVPYSGGGRLTVTAPIRCEPNPREPIAVSTTTPNPDSPGGSPLDVPLTLVVELGRLNLTLGRLADLKPGDVLELGRHSREPIELTSGGRLVARGELVQIDTELGVRVTRVFL